MLSSRQSNCLPGGVKTRNAHVSLALLKPPSKKNIIFQLSRVEQRSSHEGAVQVSLLKWVGACLDNYFFHTSSDKRVGVRIFSSSCLQKASCYCRRVVLMETTFKCKYSISVLFLAHNTLNPSPPNTLMCAAQDLRMCVCVWCFFNYFI